MPILGIMASAMSANLWQPAGAYDSLATVTVGSTAVSTITFTGIPSTYKHLQIRAISRYSGSGTNEGGALVTLNSDTSTNYNYHLLYGTGSATGAQGNANTNYMWGPDAPFGGVTASVFGAGVIDILDYTDTNKFTTIRALTGYDANGSGLMALASGAWRNTAAVTSITFTAPSSQSFVQYSSFALYGIN